MKKAVTAFLLITGLFALLAGMLGRYILKHTYLHEMQTVCRLSGAVLSAYPDAGSVLLSVILEESQSDPSASDSEKNNTDIDHGAAFLSKYGYNEAWIIQKNPACRRALRIYDLTLLAALLLTLLCGLAFFLSLTRRRRTQETQLLSLLNACLTDDYRFLEEREQLDALGNPLFADTLAKLARRLSLKTELLEKEHDNTKVLVTDISHQLKTPVSALKTCFSMCLEAETPDEQEEFLARCGMQLDRLEALTASLLQISRLETGLISLSPSPVLLSGILADAVSAVYLKAAAKEIAITTEEFEDLTLPLDRRWTAEAVSNLLDNAVKYSPAGSTVSLRVIPLYSFVRIEIEDAGIGVPPGEQAQIFRRFFRGSHPAVRNAEGTGVGLYLTRRILEDEGGTVSVRAAQQQGSIFVVQLPL